MSTKAVFLDRDGVINKTIFRNGKPRAPYTLEDLKLFEGVEEAIRKLKDAGFLTIIVTNQPDVARGWVKLEMVEAVNNKINEVLQVDDIRICYHTDEENCTCRKPRPGMIIEAAKKWNVDLEKSYMIGDRYSDVAAGVSAGCTSLLVGEGDEQKSFPPPAVRVESLLEGVNWILKR